MEKKKKNQTSSMQAMNSNTTEDVTKEILSTVLMKTEI